MIAILDHTGHRNRTREYLSKLKFDYIPEEKALEVLLYHIIPRVDTVPMARNLLARFHRISAILDAPKEQLLQVPGVGEKTAQLLCDLKLIIQFCDAQKRPPLILDSVDVYGPFLTEQLSSYKEKVYLLLFLDGNCGFLGKKVLSETERKRGANFHNSLVSAVLNSKARYVILAHNQPGNHPFPSDADRAITDHLLQTLKKMNILVLDHIIVQEGRYASMRQNGALHIL